MRVKFVVLALVAALFTIFTMPFIQNAVAHTDFTMFQDAKTFLTTLVIVCLTIIIVIFLIVSCVVAHTALKSNSNTADLLNSFMTSNNALQILTVSAVLVTAMFLALSERLTEGALALLSSVAGYVLGSLQQQKSGSSTDQPKQVNNSSSNDESDLNQDPGEVT